MSAGLNTTQAVQESPAAAGGARSSALPTIYFVPLELDRWADVLSSVQTPDPTAISRRFALGVDCWVVQTYLHLKRRGMDVRLTGQPVEGAICVAHADHFVHIRKPRQSFWVAVRPDRAPLALADLEVVQNPRQVRASSHHLIPLWPEGSLIARDAARGTRVENVVYKGRAEWLAAEFRSPDFERALSAIGMRLRIDERDWQNYSDVDVVLAVRHAPRWITDLKPASKLINAWAAGAVAVVGEESAYRWAGQAGVDHVVATDARQALSALTALRDQPSRYQSMVEAGARQYTRFCPDALAAQWVEFLANEVGPRYAKWAQTRGREGIVSSLLTPVLREWQALRWEHLCGQLGQVDLHRRLFYSPSRLARLHAKVTIAMSKRFPRRGRRDAELTTTSGG